MTRPAAELDDVSGAHARREAIEEVAVEWLAGEFAGDPVGVLPGNPVVRSASVLRSESLPGIRQRQPPPPTGPAGRL